MNAFYKARIMGADLILKDVVLFSAEGRQILAVMGFYELKQHPVFFATLPERDF
jgi:hypothetical protein